MTRDAILQDMQTILCALSDLRRLHERDRYDEIRSHVSTAVQHLTCALSVMTTQSCEASE